MTRRLLLSATAALGLAVALASCSMPGATSKQAQPFNDAPVVGRADTSAAHVVAMPDGFNNLAWKCVPGTHSGFVVTYHGDGRYGTAAHFIDPALCP